MANYKNIRIKKPGGGTRLQRVKVLASGKYKFVKNLTKRAAKARNPRASRKPRKVKKRMARRKRRRGGKSIQQQAFKWIRVGALVAPAAGEMLFGTDTPSGKIKHILRRYTGYNLYTGQFEPHSLIEGYGPFLGACLATYGIPKLVGIIRRL